jgi:hypothetical protein
MATRNIVPRANGEGSIGTSAKHWGDGQFDALHLAGEDVAGTLSNMDLALAESTGYGIVSGCEPSISGLTVTVGAGVVHLADGTRKEIAATTVTLDAADSVKPRTDLLYITSDGAVSKVTGELGTIAVAGTNTYTITTNFAAGDRILFAGVEIIASVGTQSASTFIIGANTSASATNLAQTLNDNTKINSKFTATASLNVITVTETVPGGGYTPSVMQVTGTGKVTSGTWTKSVVSTSYAPTVPDNGISIGQVSVLANSIDGVLLNARDHINTLQNDGYINVDDYGAVGDGVTDDTLAIQAAIDDASRKKCILRINGKMYKVTTLNLKSNVTIEGNGADSSILTTNINSNGCIVIDSGANNIAIRNIALLGNNQDSEYGIYFPKLSSGERKNCYIEQIKITGFSGIGIYALSGNYNVNIKDCLVAYCGTGVNFSTTDCAVDNMYVEYNVNDGFVSSGGNNKISTIKSIFNGTNNNSSWAIKIDGNRCQCSNIEAQDNFCNGIFVSGEDNQVFDCLSDSNGYSSQSQYLPDTVYSTLIKVTGNRNTVYGKCTQYRGGAALAAVGVDSSNASDDCDISITVAPNCAVTNNINNHTNVLSANSMFNYLKMLEPLNSLNNSHTTKPSLSYASLLIVGYMDGVGGFIMALTSGSGNPGSNAFTAAHIAGNDVTSYLSYTRNNDKSITITSNDVSKKWRGFIIYGGKL